MRLLCARYWAPGVTAREGERRAESEINGSKGESERASARERERASELESARARARERVFIQNDT